MKTFLISILTVLLCLNNISYSQSSIPGGEVSGIWKVEDSPFLVNGDITIPNDSTLTIEPGVTVEFQGHYSLVVLGRLLAVGTQTDSILFTVNDTTGFCAPDTSLGGWYGIRFLDTPISNDSSKIIFCRLEFSKAVGPVWHLNAGGAICILQFGKVLIANCLIMQNSAGSPTEHVPVGGGLYLFKSDVIINNNTFINNRASSGGAIFFDNSNPVFRDNVIKRNYAIDGGAIYFNGSDPIFSNNTIEENHAVKGGAISMDGESHPTFTNDKILNNFAENHGGGLLNQNSFVKFDNVTVSGNRADWGGGIGVMGGELEASACQFSKNYAKIWGGGIAGDFANLNLNNCAFSKDSSEWGSGGLHMDHASAKLTNCSFTGNNAVFGGAFHAVYSQLQFDNIEIANNNADNGGGAHIEDSDCFFDQCYFQGNNALNGAGGAIDYIVDTTIFGRSFRLGFSDCNFMENSAFTNSGAVRIEQSQSDFSLVDLVINSCQFLRNHADVYACLRISGKIDEYIVSNCFFGSNTSARYSSGPGFISNSQGKVFNSVFNSNYSLFSDSTKTAQGATIGSEAKTEFFNCTFIDTSDASGIGLSLRRGAHAEIVNTIFWGCGNRPVNLVTAAGLGCHVNIYHCNIENGIDSIYVSDSLSALHWGEGNISMDPLFADMKYGDLHLLDSSPCIGAGINSFILNEEWLTAPTRDIEGNPRPSPAYSRADMGAYENILGSPLDTTVSRTEMPEKPGILKVYPNPISDRTMFKYIVANPCFVNLSIFNMMGQKVVTLVSENQDAGKYELLWDGSGLQEGQYIFMLKMGYGHSRSGKLILINNLK